MNAKAPKILSLVSLVGVLAAGVLAYLVLPTGEAPLPNGYARVVKVIDGDTVIVTFDGQEESIRFLGIDTPETNHPTKPIECYGQEATERLKQLLPHGQVVRLERDIEPRDHYERILAYVYLPTEERDLHLNLMMVAEGYATTLPIEPNRAYRSALAEAERNAKSHNLGLWGTCGGPGVPLNPITTWAQP